MTGIINIPQREYEIVTDTITLSANSNVPPFSTYGTKAITIPSGWVVASVVPINPSSTNPVVMRCSNSGTVSCVGRTAESFSFRVVLIKQ